MGGAFSAVGTREQAAQMPYFRDLAADISAKTRELNALLDTAYAAYERVHGQAGGLAQNVPQAVIEIAKPAGRLIVFEMRIKRPFDSFHFLGFKNPRPDREHGRASPWRF